MGFVRDAIALGGAQERQSNSTWEISAWILPGGYDVEHAWVSRFFFTSEEPIKYLERRYGDREHGAFAYKLDSVPDTAVVS